ncbi:MAG: hypothetical protein LBS11_00190 [Oscillospiraceae bacterium]|nr:hypothetical protein [Oscillospiraceae bacterium]
MYVDEAVDPLIRGVGAELRLAEYPVSTLPGNSLLRQLVAQFILEPGAVKTPLAVKAWYIELTPLPIRLISRERGRSEQETQRMNTFQLPGRDSYAYIEKLAAAMETLLSRWTVVSSSAFTALVTLYSISGDICLRSPAFVYRL